MKPHDPTQLGKLFIQDVQSTSTLNYYVLKLMCFIRKYSNSKLFRTMGTIIVKASCFLISTKLAFK